VYWDIKYEKHMFNRDPLTSLMIYFTLTKISIGEKLMSEFIYIVIVCSHTILDVLTYPHPLS